MTENVLQVLTYKSVDTMLAIGGTQSWVLDRNRAKGCKYVVCCRNAHTREAEGKEAHGTAFLVGKVSDVVPSTDDDDRWLVLFSEYSVVNVGEQWEGRNPVRFYTVEDYKGDIDFDALDYPPTNTLPVGIEGLIFLSLTTRARPTPSREKMGLIRFAATHILDATIFYIFY